MGDNLEECDPMWIVKAVIGWSCIWLGILVLLMGWILGACTISIGVQGLNGAATVDPGKLAPLTRELRQ